MDRENSRKVRLGDCSSGRGSRIIFKKVWKAAWACNGASKCTKIVVRRGKHCAQLYWKNVTEKNQKAALFRVRMNGEFLAFLQRKSSDFLCIKRHCLFLCPKNPSITKFAHSKKYRRILVSRKCALEHLANVRIFLMRESVQSSLALKSEVDAFDGFL